MSEAETPSTDLPDDPEKITVDLPLDDDLIERLKADGDDWQDRANGLLLKAVGI
jgi:uncharacterized protein (DUF4415 family)